jgi:hypothetical protein
VSIWRIPVRRLGVQAITPKEAKMHPKLMIALTNEITIDRTSERKMLAVRATARRARESLRTR